MSYEAAYIPSTQWSEKDIQIYKYHIEKCFRGKNRAWTFNNEIRHCHPANTHTTKQFNTFF